MNAVVECPRVSAKAVADEIEVRGYACLKDVVSDEWLAAARAGVASYLPMNDLHELFVEHVADGADEFARALVGDRRIRALLEDVAAEACPELSMHGAPIESDLRLVQGPAPDGTPPGFHYDHTVLSLVVPIVMPDGRVGNSGELVLCPNRRPYRRRVLTNVVEKVVTQSDAYRRWFLRRQRNTTVVPLEPGNVYLFWGYRSYHATLPVPPNMLRATLILHFGSYHGGSALLAGSKSFNKKMRYLRRTVITNRPQYQVLTRTG